MNRIHTICLTAIAACIGMIGLAARLDAQLKLPRIFGDGMVLQRDANIPVWGSASTHARVRVAVGAAAVSCRADGDGNWMVYLPAMPAGGPYDVVVSARTRAGTRTDVRYRNVMLGDVWFASGQSNMELNVRQALDPDAEIRGAQYPAIRYFRVPHAIENEPQTDVRSGAWEACSPGTVGEWSALAYFFSRRLHTEYNIPVGIIEATWGGTPIEAWTSREALMTVPEAKRVVLQERANGIDSVSFRTDAENEQRFWAIVMQSHRGDSLGYAAVECADTAWRRIEMPAVFREIDTPAYEGIVWLRKTIDMPERFLGRDLTINLGYPEMMYSLYFNGKELCTNRWNAEPRHAYTVPRVAVQRGRNVIAVRMAALWGGGGLNPPAESLYVSDGVERVPLTGRWAYLLDAEPRLPTIMNYHKYPSFLFNGMVNPIVPYGVKGFLWYQGEENAAKPGTYRTMFPLLINDWRIRWRQGIVPFLYVQLPNYMTHQDAPGESNWAVLREAQAAALDLPRTGMAVTIDIGEGENIHPKNKQEAARRLFLAAEKTAYGKAVVSSGPQYASMEQEGTGMRIHFTGTGSGLAARGGGHVAGFAIAGSDGIYHTADAVIDGADVVVSSATVRVPCAVRYGWADNPECTLYNREGLPAQPFRAER